MLDLNLKWWLKEGNGTAEGGCCRLLFLSDDDENGSVYSDNVYGDNGDSGKTTEIKIM